MTSNSPGLESWLPIEPSAPLFALDRSKQGWRASTREEARASLLADLCRAEQEVTDCQRRLRDFDASTYPEET